MMMTTTGGFPAFLVAINMLFFFPMGSSEVCYGPNQSPPSKSVEWDGNGIINFVPKPGVNFVFEALTPCKKAQPFQIFVKEYDPDRLPTDVSKIMPSDGGEEEVYSCRDVINRTLDTSCTILDYEVVICRSVDEAELPEEYEGSSKLRCSANFLLECNPKNIVQYDEHSTDIFTFQSRIFVSNEFVIGNNDKSIEFPCIYQIKTFKGFQLLLTDRDEGIPLEECFQMVRNGTNCSFPTPTGGSSDRTTDVNFNKTTDVNFNKTTGVSSTAISSPRTPIVTDGPTALECLTQDVVFLLLLIFLCILLVVFVVFIILLVRRRMLEKNEKPEEELESWERTNVPDKSHFKTKGISAMKKPDTFKIELDEQSGIGENVEAIPVTQDEPEDGDEEDASAAGVDVPKTVEVGGGNSPGKAKEVTKEEMDDYSVLLKPESGGMEPPPSEFESNTAGQG